LTDEVVRSPVRVKKKKLFVTEENARDGYGGVDFISVFRGYAKGVGAELKVKEKTQNPIFRLKTFGGTRKKRRGSGSNRPAKKQRICPKENPKKRGGRLTEGEGRVHNCEAPVKCEETTPKLHQKPPAISRRLSRGSERPPRDEEKPFSMGAPLRNVQRSKVPVPNRLAKAHPR